jgi:hypothetical protein
LQEGKNSFYLRSGLEGKVRIDSSFVNVVSSSIFIEVGSQALKPIIGGEISMCDSTAHPLSAPNGPFVVRTEAPFSECAVARWFRPLML